jgi:hypothetical protein
MGKYFEIPKNELILLHCKYDSIIIYNIIIIDLPLEINQSKAREGGGEVESRGGSSVF